MLEFALGLIVCGSLGLVCFWGGLRLGRELEAGDWRDAAGNPHQPIFSGGDHYSVMAFGEFVTDYHNPVVRSRRVQ